LLGVHSRYGLHTRDVTKVVTLYTKGFDYFVTSVAAPVASAWSIGRVGFSPTGRRRLFTAHPLSGKLRWVPERQLLADSTRSDRRSR